MSDSKRQERLLQHAEQAIIRAKMIAMTAGKRDDDGKLLSALIRDLMGIATDHMIEAWRDRHDMKRAIVWE